MRVGLSAGLGHATRLKAAAIAAEEAGFSTFWVGEHVVLFEDYPLSKYPYASEDGREVSLPNPKWALCDPIVSMTWIAAATSSIELGTAIIILPQRNPVVLAKELATLDSFSGGRILFGAGVGWSQEEYNAVGSSWSDRGKRMDEYISAMRALWHDTASSFHGPTINFDRAYSFPKPARDNNIPVLIGGQSEAAMRRVARSGDGWLPVVLSVNDAPTKIGHLHALTKAEGRDPEKLRIVQTVTNKTSMDDMKRYRDAGVTDFNLTIFGELPRDEEGIGTTIAKIGESVVGLISKL